MTRQIWTIVRVQLLSNANVCMKASHVTFSYAFRRANFPRTSVFRNERIFKCKWDLVRGSVPSKFARGSIVAAMANRVQRCANCFNPELVFIAFLATRPSSSGAHSWAALGADASIFPSSAAPERCSLDASPCMASRTGTCQHLFPLGLSFMYFVKAEELK